MSRARRGLVTPLAAALLITPVLVGSATSASAAETALPSAVEDFAYPGAAGILAARGITLRSGDGHIVLADCVPGGGLVELYSRSLAPSHACFKITGATGYLALEIPEVFSIRGDSHAIKATLSSQGTVASVDVSKNEWTPVGEGSSSGATTLLELIATDGPAVSVTNPNPAVGNLTVGPPGRVGSRACTATLVAAQWVLTAASCFADDPAQPVVPAGAPSRPSQVEFPGRVPVAVTALVPRSDRDLVLGRLATPIGGVAALRVSGSAAATGAVLQAVGYGRTATAWHTGTQRPAGVTVTATVGTSLAVNVTTGLVCKGDAGGPATNGQGELVAVHSRSGQAGCLDGPGGGPAATAVRVDDIAGWVRDNTPAQLGRDYNGDGRTDIAMVGGDNWNSIPVALSKGDGSFGITAVAADNFASWAKNPTAKPLTGDFNGDGRADIAMVGGDSWDSIPVALSKGDGSFTVTATVAGSFAIWARNATAKPLTGDFNGDGRTDIAMVGGSGWNSIPVALSNGDGSFAIVAVAADSFGTWATSSSAKPLTGDFNGDGKTDIAMVGGDNWNSIPVALSKGDGSFAVTAVAADSFAIWARNATAKPLTGDFNGDGKTDIAMVGGDNWNSIPVALSRGDGSFTITAVAADNFATWAKNAAAKPLTGDFNGDGRTDIAMVGGSGWNSIPVALSNGDGSFTVSAVVASNFATWANNSSAKPLTGDYNGDGKADIAMVGGDNWNSIPVALSKGDGSFTITAVAADNFATWAKNSFAKPL
ncbi:FG-GAP-like repeat-containing protein [Longispora fulva]|uniref:Peptidase S1 domain-containing protein n=1 Tax=Longispora fulva TaxID=619741 RepID=A0A8J7KF74_9ACTN|nr:FG-GAP-like repeat-containing protein [Longispora fulva]MBG6135840.1 hypothetical protein [Longispora fulva]